MLGLMSIGIDRNGNVASATFPQNLQRRIAARAWFVPACGVEFNDKLLSGFSPRRGDSVERFGHLACQINRRVERKLLWEIDMRNDVEHATFREGFDILPI